MKLIFLCILWIGLQIFSAYIKDKNKAKSRQPQTKGQPKTLEEMLEQFSRKVENVKRQPLIRNTNLSANDRMKRSTTVYSAPENRQQDDMEPESMVAENMDAESMVAENMEAEPLRDEDLGETDSDSVVPEPEESLKVHTADNPWRDSINKRDIRAGFIMAQVLAKPRALNPYDFE